MDPATASTLATMASGFASPAAGPSMASGAAYGSTVGGLTINKPDWPALIGAALLGGAVVWIAKSL